MNTPLHRTLNYRQRVVSENHCFPFRNSNKLAPELQSYLVSLVFNKLAWVCLRNSAHFISSVCVRLISVAPREG